MVGNIKKWNGKYYLSSGAASSVLNVSHRTLERWLIDGLPKGCGKREKIEMELIKTPGGRRLYRVKSIIDLAKKFNFPASESSDVRALEELCSTETEET